MQVRKQQLELDMEQQTGSKQEKEYVKAVYCHPAYLIYIILHCALLTCHLTCLLRNLYAGQEATVRTRHRTMDWFKIGKGVCQGCVLSPCLFNLYAEYIM